MSGKKKEKSMKVEILLAAAALCGAAFGNAEVPLWPEGKIPSRLRPYFRNIRIRPL